MSTLNVSNITDGTDTVGTSYVVNGSAKAYVNFNGTGTIAVRDSFNVASLTDLGNGSHDVNLSSSFSAADYAVSGSTGGTNQSNHFNGGTNVRASAFNARVLVANVSTNDDAQVHAMAVGDLA
jgi:hypothetical protein